MSVSEEELEKINDKLNRLAETNHEIQVKLNRTSSRIEEIAKSVENNKDTTNTVYKFVEKQDYNNKNSRLWLPGIAILSLGWVVGEEQFKEQFIIYMILVALIISYWVYGRD